MQFNQQQYYSPPDNQPRAKSSRRRLFVGCVVLTCIVLIACGAGAYYLSEEERKKTAEAYGTTIINMCDPIRGGEASLDNLGENPEYPLRVVIFEEESNIIHVWQDDLPGDWQADNKDEVDAVICLQEQEPIVIEECPYEDVDTGDPLGTVRRLQQGYDIIVFSPTGERVAELEALGEMPGECEDGERFRDENQVITKTGSDVEYADFEDALRPLVLGEE